MLRQRAPHAWLVAVDPRTPRPVLDRLAAHEGVTVMPVEPPHTVEGLGRALVEALDLSAHGHLLTTRLDSDDALADGHLARLQAAFRPLAEPYFLNFPVGAMWSEGRLYRCLDPSSPFVSHVEPVEPGRAPLTAYRVAHVWAHRVAAVRQLWTAAPMWMQLIGGHNEISSLDGVRSLRRRPPRGFAGHPALARVEGGGRLAEFVRSAPRYAWAHRAALPRLLSGGRAAGH